MNLDEFFASRNFGVRAPRFHAIASGLLSLNCPVGIVETGCCRPNEHPEADGQSTLVWDYVAKTSEGYCYTVDISQTNVSYTKKLVSGFTTVHCGDSISFLTYLASTNCRPHLLYLDSMDYQGTGAQKAESALHHAGELAAIWPTLPEGALIAIDDCYGDEGKHMIVKRFFELAGIAPIVDDGIHVWKKP